MANLQQDSNVYVHEETMDMRSFSIKELERFSNVKAHTIRTWEQRYGIFSPERTRGQVRHYSLQDVVSLLNISVLVNCGHRISRLAQLTDGEINAKIHALGQDVYIHQYKIGKLIGFMFSRNIEALEALLDEALEVWGINTVIEELIMPFLERVSMLSYKDSSIETHLAVTAIRKKLILGIEQVSSAPNNAKTALLFLPKGEHFDLLLLYMCYTLKQNGFKVLYLGTNFSNENLVSICREKSPDYLYTYIARPATFSAKAYQELIQEDLPEFKLFAAYADSTPADNYLYRNVHFFDYRKMGKTLLADASCG